MKKIAFLSCEDLSSFTADDDLVIREANKKKYSIDSIPWDRSIDWSQYDIVIIRSTWDYVDRLEAFVQALEQIEGSGCHLLNALDTVKWNIDKRYLIALEQKGIRIIPTQVLMHGQSSKALGQDIEAWDCEKVLFKPVVGASSEGISIINRGDVQNYSKPGNWLVQPFISEIKEGELSFHFFDRLFSHAVKKVPKANDFRVQEEYGGDILPYAPTADELEAATAVIDAIADNLLYARVDMVSIQGKLHLMELELIEPSLYFRSHSEAPFNFLKALDAYS